MTVVGIWASHRVEAALERKDPGLIVIDEVAGMMVAVLLLPLPHTPVVLLCAFLLFRLFDIWKPFPARQVESWPEGWGIMADDWFAGLYAALVLLLARQFGWLGT